MEEKQEQLEKVEGVDKIELGTTEDIIKLYLDARDGTGLAIPIRESDYREIKRHFLALDKRGLEEEGKD